MKMLLVLACVHAKDHSNKATAAMAELWYPGVIPGIVYFPTIDEASSYQREPITEQYVLKPLHERRGMFLA